MPSTDYTLIKLNNLQIPLVNAFYKRVYKKGLARKSDHVFVIKDKDILCAAKLKEIDHQLLLTGVACTPQLRGQGVASQLLTQLLQQQRQPIYCFPYPYLNTFYSQLGFQVINLEEVPSAIALKYAVYRKKQTLLLMVFNP